MSYTHELKVDAIYFDALLTGAKAFELRKDDREPRFAVGDLLYLREWRGPDLKYSGRECMRRVTYLARGFPIPDGYCGMTIQKEIPKMYRIVRASKLDANHVEEMGVNTTLCGKTMNASWFRTRAVLLERDVRILGCCVDCRSFLPKV